MTPSLLYVASDQVWHYANVFVGDSWLIFCHGTFFHSPMNIAVVYKTTDCISTSFLPTPWTKTSNKGFCWLLQFSWQILCHIQMQISMSKEYATSILKNRFENTMHNVVCDFDFMPKAIKKLSREVCRVPAYTQSYYCKSICSLL